MIVGVSIFNVLNEKFDLNLNNSKFFAGHSLGEYTALVCAGSLSIEDAAYLLHERGKSMQEAVPEGKGAMLAILGMKIDEVEKEISTLPSNEICEIANDNSVSQVVVSGNKTSIDLLNTNLKKKHKKGILLPVSSAFHCSLMEKAAINMKDKIDKTKFWEPKPKILHKLNGEKAWNI